MVYVHTKPMNKGLTCHETKQFNNMLIKANVEQLLMMTRMCAEAAETRSGMTKDGVDL